MVDDNGDPVSEKMQERIQTHLNTLDEKLRNIAHNVFATCKNPQGDDKCERAFSIHKCWKTIDPEVC